MARLVVSVPVARRRRPPARKVAVSEERWPLWSLLPPALHKPTPLLDLDDLVDEEIDAALQDILLQLEAPEDGVSAVEPLEETEVEARVPAHAELRTQDVVSAEILVVTPEVVSTSGVFEDPAAPHAPWPRVVSQAMSEALAPDAPVPVVEVVHEDSTAPGAPETTLARVHVYALDLPLASERLAGRPVSNLVPAELLWAINHGLEAVITERADPATLARASRAQRRLTQTPLSALRPRQYEETMQVRARRAPLLPADPHA